MAVANIDTLRAYDELVASGTPEMQARSQVKLLKNSVDGLVTKEDLDKGLKNLEKDLRHDIKHSERGLKFFIITTVAGTVFIAWMPPVIGKLLGWL